MCDPLGGGGCCAIHGFEPMSHVTTQLNMVSIFEYAPAWTRCMTYRRDPSELKR